MATKGSAEGFAAKRPGHLLAEGRRWPPKGSAEGFAPKRPDHLPTEGRRWSPKGQQKVLVQSDQVTYPLRAGDDHQKVSRRCCSKETRTLTD